MSMPPSASGATTCGQKQRRSPATPSATPSLSARSPSSLSRRAPADHRGHHALCVRQALVLGRRPRAEPCPRTSPRRGPPHAALALAKAGRVRTRIGRARTCRSIAAASARLATCAAREPIRTLAGDLGRPGGDARIDPDLRPSTARRERTDRAGLLQERSRRLGRRRPGSCCMHKPRAGRRRDRMHESREPSVRPLDSVASERRLALGTHKSVGRAGRPSQRVWPPGAMPRERISPGGTNAAVGCPGSARSASLMGCSERPKVPAREGRRGRPEMSQMQGSPPPAMIASQLARSASVRVPRPCTCFVCVAVLAPILLRESLS